MLEVQFHLEQDRIIDVHFYGDFMARREIEPLTNSLRGCLFQRDSVSAVLERYSQEDYFGGIQREEVLATIFN